MNSSQTRPRKTDFETLRKLALEAYEVMKEHNATYEQILAQERWNNCYRLALKAWNSGMTVDPWIVSDNYHAFILWSAGVFSDGRLIAFTGVKRHRATEELKEG